VLEDNLKIARYLHMYPMALRDEVAKATRIAGGHVSGSIAWKTHKAKKQEASKKNKAKGYGGDVDGIVED
jgi:hypothetical protein